MLMQLLVACQQDFNLEGSGDIRSGSDPPADTGPAPGPFVDVAVACEQACVSRRDAPASCWGDGAPQAPFQPPDLVVSTIAISNTSGCALYDEGQLACWGSTLLDDPPAGAFDAVAVGGDTLEGCALAGQEATCWFSDSAGTRYWEIEPIKAISLGPGNSCTLGLDDLPTCWGINTAGEANPPAVPLRAIRAGKCGTACGVDFDGEAVCWGANRGGSAAAPPGPFQVVEAGADVTCGLHDDGTLACWGNEEQALAHPPAGAFIDLSVGDVVGCAVSAAGELACWGSDWDGLLSQAPTE